ncbi:hypothetical protein NBRC116602_01320 [Hyphomicrobiales bacterium 4NK60-0047b]|jgi:hypothetical protein
MSPLLKTQSLSTQSRTMILLSLIIFASSLFLLTKDASAGRYKLTCKGPYQLVQGNLIATPPCENAYIAKVAQSYGYKVSVKQVRNNVHKKIEICQHIGHDSRISEYCDEYNNIGGRGVGR